MAVDVSSVVNHFPSAEDGFSTTTATSTASGATTVKLNSVAGYSNGEIVAFIIEPTSSTAKQAFTGTVDTSGVQLTSVVWTSGTNQTHAAGVTVVDYWSGTHVSMTTKGILVHADQDGTLKSNSVVTANITDANVTAAKLADAAVTPEKLLAGTGTDWAWQSWTPTYSDFTLGNGTVNFAKYTEVGKTVFFRLRITLGSTSTVGATSWEVSLPKTANSQYTDNTDRTVSTASYKDVTGVTRYGTTEIDGSRTTARLKLFLVSGSYITISGDTNTNVNTTQPFTWATGDVLVVSGVYEAA